MADLRSATAPTLGVTNPLVADVKRSSEADNGGFVDVMLARLTALNHDDEDLKDIIKYQDSLDSCVRPAAADYLKNLHSVKPSEKEEVKVEAAIKPEIKEKSKPAYAKSWQKDATPVKDDRAQKLMKKVAEMLLKANESGEIQLPKELVAKLQDFVEKDPGKMAAGEVALIMRDLIETFKTLIVPQGAPAKDDIDGMKWPAEMVKAFKELGLHPGIEADKPITTMDALRALKSLANLSENNALATLSEKKQALIEMIDPDHVLLGLQPESEKSEVTVKADAAATAATKAKNSAVPQAVMDLLNKAEPAAVTAATQAAVAPQILPIQKPIKAN
jgi:hypothetical protein